VLDPVLGGPPRLLPALLCRAIPRVAATELKSMERGVRNASRQNSSAQKRSNVMQSAAT
jgi:hypothetical protein